MSAKNKRKGASRNQHQIIPIKDRLLRRRNITDTGCWEWTGHIMKKGYGQIGFMKKVILVHRASYETFVGKIPNGMFVCHKCDNPKCFNPNHLFVGTSQDNINDMVRKGRQRSLKGEASGQAKLTNKQVEEIRKTHIKTYPGGRGSNTAELADKFNITKSYILQLVNMDWRKDG
jgi:hypothetical protein